MNEMILRFPDQLREAIAIGQSANIQPSTGKINQVFVVGMGGSGIGGNFVAEFVRNECPVPYLIGQSYDIPKYVDQNTLAIISSYSGNTEESLIALNAIEKTGARIIVISSGGKAIARAQEKNYDYIQVPGNWSSPRACLGYSIVQQLFVLNKLGLIPNAFEKDILTAANLLDHEIGDIQTLALEVAEKIIDKTAVIYSVDRMEPNAIRLRQQINENGKLLCWHHVIPEMNHNELIGWKKKRNDIAVIVLRNEDDYSRNQARMNITKNIINKLCGEWIEIYSKGESQIEKSFYLVHVSDWISYYLSEIQELDAIEIQAIDYLKGELAKQKL